MRDVYLNSRFRQSSPLGQFFSGINIWILSSLERSFQLFELLSGERRSASTLLSLKWNAWLALSVGVITATT